MKKASQILLLIAGIIGILGAVAFMASMAVAFCYLQGVGFWCSLQGIVAILMDQGVLPANEILVAIFGKIGMEGGIMQLISGVFAFVVSYVVLVAAIVVFVFNLVAAVIALKSRGKKDQEPKKGLFIANFVLAGLTLFVFAGTWLSYMYAMLAIAGSILGLIALKKSKEEAEAPQEEPEAEPVVEEIN